MKSHCSNYLFIFNTRIDNLAKNAIVNKIRFFLRKKTCAHITTLNPEILLIAHKNKQLRKIINAAQLNVADGIGIFFAFLRFGCLLQCRFTGIDLMEEILAIAHKQRYSVFLVARKDGLSSWEETRDAILRKKPSLDISGCNIDAQYADLSETQKKELHKKDILFVNFGAPNQEFFINECQNVQKSSLRLAVGVGGAFDYITHNVPRAPKFMRKIGMEWFFRLIVQPRRIHRIFHATIIFPFYVIFTSFHKPHRQRKR